MRIYLRSQSFVSSWGFFRINDKSVNLCVATKIFQAERGVGQWKQGNSTCEKGKRWNFHRPNCGRNAKVTKIFSLSEGPSSKDVPPLPSISLKIHYKIANTCKKNVQLFRTFGLATPRLQFENCLKYQTKIFTTLTLVSLHEDLPEEKFGKATYYIGSKMIIIYISYALSVVSVFLW